jgi:hypothetical protein
MIPFRPRPAVTIKAGSVEVRFEWDGDRFGHAITAAGSTHAPWRSVEGPAPIDGDARWPRSPVFVEISRLGARSDSPLLAVGSAGRTHFSAVVSPDPELPGAIRFEIAARLQEPPLGLGSCYRGTVAQIAIEPPPCVSPSLPCTVQWSYRVVPEGIQPLAGARLSSATPQRWP